MLGVGEGGTDSTDRSRIVETWLRQHGLTDCRRHARARTWMVLAVAKVATQKQVLQCRG